MTEEELRGKIADIIDTEDKNSFALPCMDIADQILTLIKEAGWKSPEEWNKNEIKWMNIVQGMREANGTV
jgi:hypothetical protein